MAVPVNGPDMQELFKRVHTALDQAHTHAQGNVQVQDQIVIARNGVTEIHSKLESISRD